GEKDASGRPRPVKVENSTQRIEVDCVIPAIGQKTSINFFPEDRLKIDPITSSTQLKNVFAGGDAVHGTSTLVQAIADGRKAAENILASASAAAGKSSLAEEQEIDYSQLQKKLARRQYRSNRPETLTDNPLGFEYVPILFKEEEIKKEANRCLSCDLICTICVTVCPNRANVVYRTRPFDIQCQLAVLKSGKVIIENLDRFQIQQDLQIINIGDFCNECGNCVTFCPTSGSPHETKPKFYLTWEKYQSEENGHFLKGNEIRRKINSEESVLRQVGNMLEYKTEEIKALLETSTLIVKEAVFMTTETNSIDLSEAAEMGVLLRSLKDSFIFIP
ncbi:hypothetical protein KKA14_08890, partial [bacterium]|nr:hypothetical protein [bacterium]